MLLLLEGYLTAAQFGPPRLSGGKRIAAYTVSNDGKLKEEMSRLREIERQQEEADAEIIAAILAWWNG